MSQLYDFQGGLPTPSNLPDNDPLDRLADILITIAIIMCIFAIIGYFSR
jgi:hypothetical protein